MYLTRGHTHRTQPSLVVGHPCVFSCSLHLICAYIGMKGGFMSNVMSHKYYLGIPEISSGIWTYFVHIKLNILSSP